MKDVLDLTKKIVRIPSTTGNYKSLDKVLEICEDKLKDYSFKEFVKNSSRSLLFYNGKKIPKKFRLILNAHLDVVPGKSNQFITKIVGDKLFGRGTQDMKAAASVFVLLFSELARDIPYPIGLQLVTDEEIGGFLGTKYQIDNKINSDFVIAGEPTDMLINNQAKGVLWVEFTIKGKTAHSAYLWNGDNAIVKTNNLINLLLKKFPVPKMEQWQTTCNIAKIETNNKTTNKVPDMCKLVVDIRYVPSELKTVRDIISKFSNESTSIKYLEEGNASITNETNKDIRLLNKILKDYKQPSGFIKKHGSSDIRFYNALGIDGITFGPVGGGLHSDNEWVGLNSLSTYYKVMKTLLKNLCYY